MDIKKQEARKDKVDLSLLEEEDELEEFPVKEWQGQPEDEDLTIWEDNWDDDNIEDDFCKQLKADLDKRRIELDTTMQ